MALQLMRAIGDGFRRTFTRAGGILFAGLLLLQFGIQTSINTAFLSSLPAEGAEQVGGELGLTLPVSGGVGMVLFAVCMIASWTYFVMLSRTFAQPLDEASTFPGGLTERLGRTTLIALVGGILLSIIVMIGFTFFVIPGVFLAASLMFFIFVVAVENGGVLGSLKRSWELARGSRLKLMLLVIASGVFGLVIGIVGPLVRLAGVPIVADVLSIVLSSVFFLPYYAIIASAYLQLRDERPSSNKPASKPIDPSQTPEL